MSTHHWQLEMQSLLHMKVEEIGPGRPKWQLHGRSRELFLFVSSKHITAAEDGR